MSRYAGLLGRRSGVPIGIGGLVVSVALLVGGPHAAGESPTAGSPCPHANAQPAATIGELRHATLCLINNARADAGVGALTLDPNLNGMARHHTKVMLAHNCLKHICAGELSLVKRLKASGYLDGATKWWYAEDLGYESTPKRMVDRWLSTTLDETNLLSSDYVDVGIGPGRGAAAAGVSDTPFVTYTIDLAARTPPK